MKKVLQIDKQLRSICRKYFDIDFEKGEMRWKIKRSMRIKIGELAGSINKSTGYRIVKIDRKDYLVHRLLWCLYHNQDMPSGLQIDHINGVKSDNRMCNLRLVTDQGNKMNMAKRIDNTSGCVGVHWCKRTGKWLAKIKVNGNGIHLGYFIDFNEAVQRRNQAEREHGYHENHGREAIAQ